MGKDRVIRRIRARIFRESMFVWINSIKLIQRKVIFGVIVTINQRNVKLTTGAVNTFFLGKILSCL